jgi:hypothetical protein
MEAAAEIRTIAGAPVIRDAEPAQFVLRNRDGLVEVLRARKAQLALSNAFVEAQLQMADSGCDKILGPYPAKGISVPVMFDLVELFGCRLVLQVDPEMEASRASHPN